MFDETPETEETTDSCVPSVQTVIKCMVLGASVYVIGSKALLYYRLRKATKADVAEAEKYHAQETAK